MLVTRSREVSIVDGGDQTGLDVPCCAENVSHTLPRAHYQLELRINISSGGGR